MSYEGLGRGRRKALPAVRIVHHGNGTASMYKDDVWIVTANLTLLDWFQVFSPVEMNKRVNYVEVFDSTGEIMLVALGGIGSEVVYFQILPGGNGGIPVRIDPDNRISIKAGSALPEADTETTINFYD